MPFSSSILLIVAWQLLVPRGLSQIASTPSWAIFDSCCRVRDVGISHYIWVCWRLSWSCSETPQLFLWPSISGNIVITVTIEFYCVIMINFQMASLPFSDELRCPLWPISVEVVCYVSLLLSCGYRLSPRKRTECLGSTVSRSIFLLATYRRGSTEWALQTGRLRSC